MIDTYTPLYDSLVAELGLLRAAVLCAVLRYCALRDGLCRASTQTIAERLHLSRGSVHKALKQLAADGYIVDLTPNWRNAPHRYRDGGRIPRKKLDQAVSTSPAPAARQEPEAAVHPVHSAVQDVNVAVHDVNATVQDVNKKKELRDKKETREDSGASAPPLPHPPEIAIVQQTCGHLPPRVAFDVVVEAVRQVGKRLGRAPRPADLSPFWSEWVGRGYNPLNHGWLLDWAASGKVSRNRMERWHVNKPATSARPAHERLSPAEHDRLVRFYNGLAAA